MSQELYYTSAPKGLRSGSHGYCTVAATSGMPPNLAEKLESLTGYRHLFAPSDANAALNPVVHSYLRIALGGKTCFILSRVCDSGLDYTKRNNKFAHHLVLDQSELPAAGPAWLLSQPAVMERAWQGDPRVLPSGRRVPNTDLRAGVCRAWEQATGDAGWAGVLAEAASRGAFLVFPPGMDVLRLFLEAQTLLSPARRWSTTFSTYYTRLPAGVECLWRAVVAGSAEAKSARAVPDALVIDLTRPMGPAEGGALVAAARSGVLPEEPAKPKADRAPAANGRAARGIKAPPASAVAAGDYSLTSDRAPPPAFDSPPIALPNARQRTGGQKSSWPQLVAVAAVALLCGLIAGISLERFWLRPSNVHLSQAQQRDAAQAAQPPEATPATATPAKAAPAKARATPSAAASDNRRIHLGPDAGQSQSQPDKAHPAPTPAPAADSPAPTTEMPAADAQPPDPMPTQPEAAAETAPPAAADSPPPQTPAVPETTNSNGPNAAAPPPAKVQPVAGANPPSAAPPPNSNTILVLPSAAALGTQKQAAIITHSMNLPYEVELLGGDSKTSTAGFVLKLVKASGANNALTIRKQVGIADGAVADVQLENGQLAFSWQKQEPKVEALLYDCALVLKKSGTVAQVLQFRPIDFPESLHLELDSSQARSKASFEKPTTLSLTLGVLNCPPDWVAIQTSGHKVQLRPKNQQVKLRYEVTLQPQLPTGGDRPTGATVELKQFYEGAASPVAKSRKDLETQRKQVQKEMDKAKEAKPDADTDQLRRERDSLDAALTALRQLPNEPLRYRIYSMLGDHQIDFAISSGSAQ